jgi:hypothetical protein
MYRGPCMLIGRLRLVRQGCWRPAACLTYMNHTGEPPLAVGGALDSIPLSRKTCRMTVQPMMEQRDCNERQISGSPAWALRPLASVDQEAKAQRKH